MEKISITKEQEELSKLIKHVVSNQKRIILQQDGQEIVILPGNEVGFWHKLMSIFTKIVEDRLDTPKTKKRLLGSLQNKGSVKFADDFTITDEELLQS